MPLRFIYAKGAHAELMRQNMLESPLSREGDCILVWINEGDFWGLNPIDMDAEDKERREYERLKAKFEPTKS